MNNDQGFKKKMANDTGLDKQDTDITSAKASKMFIG